MKAIFLNPFGNRIYLRGKPSWTGRLGKHWGGGLAGHSSVDDCGGRCVEGGVIGGVEAWVVGRVKCTWAVVAVVDALGTPTTTGHQPWGTWWRAGIIYGHLLWGGVQLWWRDWIISVSVDGLLVGAGNRRVIHCAAVDHRRLIVWVLVLDRVVSVAVVIALTDRCIIAPVRHILISPTPARGVTTVWGVMILFKGWVISLGEGRLVGRVWGVGGGTELRGWDQSWPWVFLYYLLCGELQVLGSKGL